MIAFDRGRRWRSSDTFIISTMSMALFTDELLFAFMVPLLPYIFENRIGVDSSFIQRYTSIFLAEGALISVLSSPLVGSIADKARSEKLLLLILLALTLISVVCLSLTPSLPWLFVGRLFQSLTSNALWIVGMASLAKNIGSEHMGKIAGLTSTLTAVGTCAGPVMAGFLFGIGGYWTAWTGAIAFLVVDIIMRLLMIEKPKKFQTQAGESAEGSENDPLLNGNTDRGDATAVEEKGGWKFYTCLFRHRRFTAGIFCFYIFALFIASIEATIVVHVRYTFGWGEFPVGLLMACIQGPGMVLAPMVGWMKDRRGSRIPTTVGFFLLVPFLFFLGAPGDERFPWMNVGTHGKVIYTVCIFMAGCLMCLLNGVGTMEATETVDELEARHPGIFGPAGGYSRAMAVTNMSWMGGLLTGPILTAFVIERFGYFELQCILALASFLGGVTAVFNLSTTGAKAAGE